MLKKKYKVHVELSYICLWKNNSQLYHHIQNYNMFLLQAGRYFRYVCRQVMHACHNIYLYNTIENTLYPAYIQYNVPTCIYRRLCAQTAYYFLNASSFVAGKSYENWLFSLLQLGRYTYIDIALFQGNTLMNIGKMCLFRSI